ncbi:MAG: DUF4406 domain-containing protein [Oscillospiraceae bacterium]
MNTMRKPLKVFLSGPISSRMETYKAEFDDAARIVIEAGHLPLNPATLPIGMESRDYMRICLAMLDSADLLLQLPGWGKSAGAIAERTVAMKTGVESLTLEDFIREYGPERVPAEPEPPSEPEQLLSRVERLFGRRESWPNATAAATPSQDKPKAEAEETEDTGPEASFSRRAVKGFLIVECENCGQTREFCSRAEITSNRCHSCGHVTTLDKTYMRPAYAKCKCGREFKYQTNATGDTITINCIACGSPIDMQLNGRGTAYVTLRDAGGALKPAFRSTPYYIND